MNLLLVDARELAGDLVRLDDRRATHLRGVLGAGVGARVRAGVIGGGVGLAEVIADDGLALTLRLGALAPARPPLPVELVLAVPRPKVLSRTVEIAAAFGVARIALTNAWRVDKSYLASPRLAPDALAAAARLGAEQGATTHVPEVVVHRRLMALLDARWPAASRPGDADAGTAAIADVGADTAAEAGTAATADIGADAVAKAYAAAKANAAAGADAGEVRLIAHPGGRPLEEALVGDARGPITLAIGPEGGWIAREVETFEARGFVAVSLGDAILRVEAAVAAALGQLVLLRRLRGAG